MRKNSSLHLSISMELSSNRSFKFLISLHNIAFSEETTLALSFYDFKDTISLWRSSTTKAFRSFSRIKLTWFNSSYSLSLEILDSKEAIVLSALSWVFWYYSLVRARSPFKLSTYSLKRFFSWTKLVISEVYFRVISKTFSFSSFKEALRLYIDFCLPLMMTFNRSASA